MRNHVYILSFDLFARLLCTALPIHIELIYVTRAD